MLRKQIITLLLLLVIAFPANGYGRYTKPRYTEPDLLYYFKRGNITKVKDLINKGTNVNVKNREGITALIYAAFYGHKDIVELLLNNNADVFVKDKDGKTALIYAKQRGYRDIAELLQNAEDYERPPSTPAKPALIATHKKAHIDIIFDSDITNKLIEAIRDDDIATVKALVEDIGANVPIGGSKQRPLLYAAEYGHKDIAQLLIAKGADINAKTNDGWTALMAAAKNDNPEVVKVLLKKGADVNAKTNDGWTAIMNASSSGHKDIVKLLKKTGAIFTFEDWMTVNWLLIVRSSILLVSLIALVYFNIRCRKYDFFRDRLYISLYCGILLVAIVLCTKDLLDLFYEYSPHSAVINCKNNIFPLQPQVTV